MIRTEFIWLPDEEKEITESMLGSYFTSRLAKWAMKGADLWLMLEGVYSKVNYIDPQKKGKSMMPKIYLHFSKGIKIKFDRSSHSKNGSRLKSVLINGKPLDKEVKYTFGTLEWILMGQEDIYLKVPTKEYKPFGGIRDAMTNYIIKHKTIEVKYEGRLVDVGVYK